PGVHPVEALDTTTYPLTVRAYADESLHVELTYDPRLFDEGTITSLGERLTRVLDALGTDPGQRVRELPWLSRAEVEQVLFDWNGTAVSE
ncbi:hypothetical protein K7G98_40270, partial [Saccharothrix sp. MB29]|nr:hypothetical protein [Saccharothrix sp. MB29]